MTGSKKLPTWSPPILGWVYPLKQDDDFASATYNSQDLLIEWDGIECHWLIQLRFGGGVLKVWGSAKVVTRAVSRWAETIRRLEG
jgi:hypothetical protein